MAVNDTIQLAVKGTVAGQTHVHTLHFRDLDLVPDESLLIDRWQAGCRTAYRALFDNEDQPCQLYTARQVCGTVPLRAPAEEAEVAPNIVGASDFTTDRSPAWLASVVSVRTALAGKSRRGRFFIGGLFEQQLAGENIVAGLKTNLTTYVTTLMTLFGPTGTDGKFQIVVHSPTLASVPGTPCQSSSTPVTAFLVRDAVGTMKSRKPGSGT